jgi:misacylated tRNA(Ala) deacylase
MAIYLCHEQPDLFVHTATVVDARPGAVALSHSAFHPGGGGQVSDIGSIEWDGGSSPVTGVEVAGDVWWHLLADDAAAPTGDVEVRVDAEHRLGVASLHTASHILNAFVFTEFAGALVTGAQINGDGTGRMDFDLPEVDNDKVRALAVPVNEVIGRGVEVNAVYVDAAAAATTEGLVRSMSVAPPPTPDGRLRLIDIVGIDRQACGGTHLSNTGQSRPIVITKVENKGRHNRRVRFAFAP